MGIQRLNRNIAGSRHSSVLDKTLTVKDLLVYTGYFVAALVALFIIVLIPFMIGRASVDCSCDDVNKSERVAAATDLIGKAASNPASKPTEETVDEGIVEMNSTEDVENTSVSAEANDTYPVVGEEPEEETYDETVDYLRTDPRVATKYTDVDIELLDFDYEMRGEDWGTINRVKVMFHNDQSKIVIPYSLKMKIYNVGDSASDWWDDEINLRDYLNIIVPDDTKTLTLDTHVSFSDIDSKKRISIYLFDEVGKQMASRTKEISIEG